METTVEYCRVKVLVLQEDPESPSLYAWERYTVPRLV